MQESAQLALRGHPPRFQTYGELTIFDLGIIVQTFTP
jgi:hypothetical protein